MDAEWERRLVGLAGSIQDQAPRVRVDHRLQDHALSAAFDAASRVTRQHSKSFHLASGLLPALKRKAVRALYAFCRTVDDIVDESGGSEAASELETWRNIVLGIRPPGSNPVAAAWVETQARFHIPKKYALQLIEGVARDLVPARYQTFDQLSTYCYGVASTVGLMSMHIIGFHGPAALRYAIKLGVALQMTNILRDVGEDFRSGRIYLPQDELRAFGIPETSLAAGPVSRPWREFMRFQISRARKLYLESRPGIRMLQRDGRVAVAAASRFYEGILAAIENNDYNVFSRRASLNAWQKLRTIPHVLVEWAVTPSTSRI